MKPNQHNRVQSPYVVVLGGNSVRKKSAPPTHIAPREATPEKPEAHVYGVLPPLKTMSQDLREVEPPVKKEAKKRWWSFGEKKKRTEGLIIQSQVAPHKNPEGNPLYRGLPSGTPPRVIDIPTEVERVRPSPYRGRFLRGIAKKGYLTSKLAVELPFHAKVGMGIAVLVLIVGLPILSRFAEKPAAVTAGTIVAIGTDALVAQVGRSIELPSGETPLVVIATADDIRRLNVPDAKPGHKILLYQQSGKIVVYDGETDKVLGVVHRSQP